MKMRITIATSNVDSVKDQIILEGVKLGKRVKLTRNFDRYIPPMGEVKEVFIEGCELKIEVDIPGELNHTYPAIGFRLLKHKVIGGIKIIQELELIEVSLCDTQNMDRSIKTIGEQSKA